MGWPIPTSQFSELAGYTPCTHSLGVSGGDHSHRSEGSTRTRLVRHWGVSKRWNLQTPMSTCRTACSGLTGLWMHANGVTLRLSPAGLSPGSCVPSSPAPGALSPWLSSGNGQQCMLIRPMSYGRHRLGDASSLSLMRVDAVRAMRTRMLS